MAPNKKKQQPPPANAEIIREQIQLMQTEKELKLALEKVKDNINKLLVGFPIRKRFDVETFNSKIK